MEYGDDKVWKSLISLRTIVVQPNSNQGDGDCDTAASVQAIVKSFTETTKTSNTHNFLRRLNVLFELLTEEKPHQK